MAKGKPERVALRRLTAAEQRVLTAKLKDLRLPARIHQRYRSVAAARSGASVPTGARRVGCHVTVAYFWVDRFNASGLRTFERVPNPRGRIPTVTPEQSRELVDVALSSPRERGLPFSTWTVATLAAYCRQRQLEETVLCRVSARGLAACLKIASNSGTQRPVTTMTRAEILARIRELRPWFQNVPLGDGIFTKDLDDPTNSFPGQNIPWGLWERIKKVIPARLTGLRVLDVGCNAGFYSFRMRERGADVVGIDIDQGTSGSFVAQARFCNEVLAAGVEFRHQDLFDVPETSPFDLILFLGVFYHVPNFCDALVKLRALTHPGGWIAVESQVSTPSLTCYDGKGFRGDPTTFFVPSPAVLRTLLMEHGFRVKKEVVISEERHFFFCRRR
ncbi:MAG TPA: DUF1698 domain-containing protein [Candidatus Binatia bacterium]|jgi:2-polyprenyl-3-methyl-5-hydroxy-6-metoxy-1,4-benzoquinol methylase|nr:DUF1698 domain-containing protein [Candidatus Binatia bacterium]